MKQFWENGTQRTMITQKKIEKCVLLKKMFDVVRRERNINILV